MSYLYMLFVASVLSGRVLCKIIEVVDLSFEPMQFALEGGVFLFVLSPRQ
jgi:hypothetical protein